MKALQKSTVGALRLMCVMMAIWLEGGREARAINAGPAPVDVKQADGTPLRLTVHGEPWFNWLEDAGGFTVIADKKNYVYASLDADGRLAPTGLLAGKVKPETAGLQKGILPTPEIMRSYREAATSPQVIGAAASPQGGFVDGPAGVPPLGTVKNLVILCKFSDHVLGTHTRAAADYDVVLNTVGGNATLAPTGSVRDYYTQTSYGQMTMQSTVVGWVNLPQTEAYYADGSNGTRGIYPKNAQRMTEDALAAADATTDFGQFDADNDGFIDAITIIHSGYGAETGGGGGNWIWSHRWSLPSNWTSGDNNGAGVRVKVRDYHTEPALWGTSGTGIVRIGVICHELGHFFGLPDLYDTDGSSRGIGSWCLMANSWGFDGTQQHPPHPSAWCKVRLGWVTPAVVSTGTHTALRVETSPSVFKITAGFPANEYLLVENRQPFGFETTVPGGGGLAVWHIDETKTTNRAEGFPGQSGWPANNNHYEVALLAADGQYHLERNTNSGDGGDLYRAGGATAIMPTTVPNTHRYQGGVVAATNNTITSISATGASMTFVVNAAVSGPPVITSATTATGAQGAAFTYQISATNIPTSYNATGLPSGLTVSTATGAITGVPNSAGTFNVALSATNSLGTGNANLSLTINAGLSFGAAFDNTGVTWSAGGNASWMTQTTTTHDGVDAGQSGALGDAQESWVQATFTGPGTLDFWWSVSSEPSWDFLNLLVDDVLQTSISGLVAWEQRSVTIPAGAHTVRWRYAKDSSVASGADAGFLDQVSFTAGFQTPVITSALSAVAIAGQTFAYQITATGGPTSYNATGLPAGLTVNTATGLISGTPSAAGASAVNISATNSAGTDTETLNLNVVTSVTLSAALDDPGLVWSTGGNANWFGQVSTTHDLADAGQTGDLADSQESWVQAPVTGPGTLTFWWNVSSEVNYDYHRFEIDGVQQDAISGTPGWTQKTVTIAAGAHVLRWRYSKDSSVSTGTDAAYLDQVTWGENAFLPVITSAGTLSGAVGVNVNYQITAINTPTSFTASGLPPGLSVNPATGLISGPPSAPGVFNATISASNAAGTGTAALVCTITSGLTLAVAVDATALTWTTGGGAVWAGETTTTHDGSHAGQSGDVNDAQESWAQTTISGPGTLTFWWNVSSETGYDFLRFEVAGTEQAAISGVSGWQQKTITIPVGTHTCRWRYTKDTSESAGADAGWLDQVAFFPGLQTPVITSATFTDAVIGQAFSFQLTAANSTTSFGATALPPGLSVNPVSGLITGVPTSLGTFTVAVSATNGTGTTNGSMQIVITSTLSLPNALDAQSLVWTTGGNAVPFAVQAAGYDYAQTGDVLNNGESWVQTSITGPVTLSFRWGVSSETNFDFLAFELDSVEQFAISGEVSWENRVVTIPAGTHTCRWGYSKDSSVSAGLDAGWIDQVTISRPAQLQFPVGGFTFTAEPTTFTWNPGQGVTSYWLAVGSAPGGGDLFSVSQGTNLAKTVTGLPDDGRPVYVTLYSLIGGLWQSDARAYIAYTGPQPVKARIISPANGSNLPDTTLALVWDAGVSVTDYYLSVGRYAGGTDLYGGSQGTNLSRTLNVPADGKVFVTLWSLARGVWRSNSYVFIPPASVRAVLASPAPANGSTLTDGNLLLNWTQGVGVTSYYLWIGSTYGGHDLAALNMGADTSRTFAVPTDGGPIYVTLWSYINGAYVTNSYWFITAATAPVLPARITSPAPASTFGGTSVVFNWQPANAPAQYYLYVGSNPDGNDLYYGDQGTALTRTVALPGDGRRAYVTLFSLIAGVWHSNAYFFTCATVPNPAAQITSPANGSTLADANLPLAWGAVADATSYYLSVGGTPGGADIYSGSQGLSLAKTVIAPTDGRLIYVTLWSLIRGVWQQSLSWYTTFGPVSGGRAARMTSPVNGSALSTESVTFQWDAGISASNFVLWIGSSPGGYDLLSASMGASLSRTVTLPTDGRKLYATLWSYVGGAWKSNIYLHTAVNITPVKAAMLTPAPGSVLPSATATFTWNTGTTVTSYYLSIGRAPLGSDVLAASLGTSLSRTVTTLPTDGGPVYVTLWSLIRGAWQYNEYIYNAAPGP